MKSESRALLLELLLLREKYPAGVIRQTLQTLQSEAGFRELQYLLDLVDQEPRRGLSSPRRESSGHSAARDSQQEELTLRERSLLKELTDRLAPLTVRNIRQIAQGLDVVIPERSSRENALIRIARVLASLPVDEVRKLLDERLGPARDPDNGFAELAQEIMRRSPSEQRKR